MLIEFSIENFRSIKDEVTFSLLSSPDNSLETNTFSSDALNKNDSLLRSAAIYGANASGKSNVIMAFGALKHMVLNSIKNQSGDKIEYNPFKLDEDFLQRPTKFKIVFIHNNVQYVYGVAFNSERITEEYLYYYPKGRKSTIFDRKIDSEPHFTKDRRIQKQIFDRTLDNVLYLSNSAQQKYDKTIEVFNWFRDEFTVVEKTDNPSLMDQTVRMLNESNELKETIVNSLIEADVGIYDIFAEYKEFTFEGLINSPKNNKYMKSSSRMYVHKKGGVFETVDIKTIHKTSAGKELLGAQFDFYSEESDGTQRLFFLIGPFIDALKYGKTLVVDELDVRMHPLLSEYLIKLFHDPSRNQNNAQLVFTTHNVNLLDQKLFRRGQIWFTEKNPDNGCSDLYSLTEFSPRNDKNIQKGYLAGRYGALPFINY